MLLTIIAPHGSTLTEKRQKVRKRAAPFLEKPIVENSIVPVARGTMAMKCPNCGSENPVGKKFCGECGNKLEVSSHRMCVSCGRPIPFDAMLCQYCGYDYRSQMSGAPAARSTTPAPSRPISTAQAYRVSSSHSLLNWAVLVLGLWLIAIAVMNFLDIYYNDFFYLIVTGSVGSTVFVLAIVSIKNQASS